MPWREPGSILPLEVANIIVRSQARRQNWAVQTPLKALLDGTSQIPKETTSFRVGFRRPVYFPAATW
jgi:hypothetical protein